MSSWKHTIGRMTWTVLFASVLALVPACSTNGAAVAEQSEWIEQVRLLEEDLPEWMEEAGIPGLSIAVLGPSGDWVQQFGVVDRTSGRPVTASTVFEAASLSKPVFAHLVLQSVSDGVLDLDASLNSYWEYPDLLGDPRADSVTARIVLAHRTGLPNWRRNGPLEFQFQPGARFSYSGEGYVYLQHTLSAVLGEDLHELAFREILEPLGMNRSSFLFEDTDPDFAAPHNGDGGVELKRQAPPPGNAAHSFHTTAGDYARFLRAVMDEELLDAGELSRISVSPDRITENLAWGLGWGLEFIPGREAPALWHWGDNGAFKAFAYLDPESGRGVVFFANSSSGLMLIKPVLDRLFPGEHPQIEWLGYDQL